MGQQPVCDGDNVLCVIIALSAPPPPPRPHLTPLLSFLLALLIFEGLIIYFPSVCSIVLLSFRELISNCTKSSTGRRLNVPEKRHFL